MTEKSHQTAKSRAQPRDITLRWRERAAQWLNFPLGRFCDYGCGTCGLLELVQSRCVECRGVDVDTDKIAAAKALHPDFALGVIGIDGKTDYPDEHFDTIAIVEVIEHVPDEAATLAELTRILKPGGRLLLTTPHRGWLTFLDPGNFKFIFPGLHRFVHLRLLRNPRYFAERFTRAESLGMVGDISTSTHRRPWHRHYKPGQIQKFCPPDLMLENHAVYFPGLRAMMLVQALLRVCTAGILKRLPWPLSAMERALSRVESSTGDQLVMLFRKKT